ncbi:hypothetical protein K474DRAFT_1662839 [Panus rudis PR-1116 ss-1]|nr:hypothetical protein K474DRAFT_1662839 [Panus rudis PR-1116 ss-1]
MHKEKCKLNRRCLDVGDDLAAENALLRAFTGKHRPVIADSAIRALDIQKEPSRAKTHFLLIRLRKRSGRLRTETAYFVMDAEVVPYAAVPEPKRTEMQRQLKLAFENQKRAVPDTVGTVFAMLVCVDPITNVGVSNVAPISFQPDVETLEQIIPGEWKQTLVMMLNEGVVL